MIGKDLPNDEAFRVNGDDVVVNELDDMPPWRDTEIMTEYVKRGRCEDGCQVLGSVEAGAVPIEELQLPPSDLNVDLEEYRYEERAGEKKSWEVE